MGMPKINFIGMSNTIEVKDRPGNVQVHISINDLEVTDKEMSKIRDLQQETTAKLKAILNKRESPGRTETERHPCRDVSLVHSS